MKIKLLLIAFSFVFTKGFGQTESILQSADSVVIINLMKKIGDLEKQSVNNATSINALLTGKDLDATNKYLLIKQNLVNAVSAFQLLNSKINILKSKASSDKIDVFIKDLINPQSNALNFKFDEIIIRLVNENIQPKKKNLAKNIIETISSISQSPIVTNIPTISPAVSVANSVLGLLRSTSIMNEQIDQPKIKAFELALNNYVQYYEALNEGNTGFTYNLTNQIHEINLLQSKLYDQVTFFAKTLNYPILPRISNEDLSTYLNNLFLGFNNLYIDKMFRDLEKSTINPITNKLNYDAMLISNNGNLKDANNRLEEFIGLINQFEFQYNGYFNIYEFYNSKIVHALDVASTNKIADQTLINNKKNDFTALKSQAVIDIKSSLNLPELLLSKQTIKYTARIL
ncbi:hypothetical protein ACR780_07445 [Sphingobacterium faecium]|uniref:hypothetical protein n=1 Tax=Sphingobacterium faecium TaxID=34087 RepID=UPI003DA69BC9